MKKNILVLAIVILCGINENFAQTGNLKESLSLIANNLSSSKQSIKQYSWIETTTVFFKGEQKSVIQNQCYYDVNGVLTKVPTGGSQQAKQPGGIRGVIAKNKKEDIETYISKAKDVIKGYIPPQSEKLQQNYGAGNASINILVPNQKVKLNFSNYNQNQDLVSITFDVVNQILLDYSVKTFVSDPSDVVNFDAMFAKLPDGTQYPDSITFNSASQNLKIVIQNSGYTTAGGR